MYMYIYISYIYIIYIQYIYIYNIYIYIYAIVKTMWPSGYHHNGFVATHAIGHMMCGLYIIIIRYALSLKCSILAVNNRAIYIRMIKK